MTDRVFYCKVVKVEILSEDPIEDLEDLEAIHYAITYGECSGKVSSVDYRKLNGHQAAMALMSQESDPGFFMLDHNGNDLK